MHAAKPPLISVIIPTYNRREAVMNAIESVKAQTFSDWELVVVDDGSSDGTRRQLLTEEDSRVRLLAHDRNKGAAAARNTGIQHSRGEYIAFLDSDDLWLPPKLNLQLEALKSAPQPNTLCCTGFYWHLLEQGVVKETPRPPVEDFLGLMLQGCALSPGTTLMAPRAVFAQVGLFDETLRRFEDWDWLLRFADAGGQLVSVPSCQAHVYTTRRGVGLTTSRAAPKFLSKNKPIFERRGKKAYRQALGAFWFQVAGALRHEGRWLRMLLTLLKAHVYDPTILYHYLRKRKKEIII